MRKLRNQLRCLQCILPRFGKHDEQTPGSRIHHEIAISFKFVLGSEYPRKNKAGSNNSNRERRLGHRSHITDSLKEQAIFQYAAPNLFFFTVCKGLRIIFVFTAWDVAYVI